MRALLVLLLLCLPGVAAAGSLEADYLASRDGYIAKFKPLAAGDVTPALDKAMAAAQRDLEQRLRRIIGPLDMTGFARTGTINLDTLIAGDEGFGMLDALVFSSPDKKTRAIVTTSGLFDAWRNGHKAWWDHVANPPTDAAQALRSEAFYTQAISTDAAVSIFSEVPVTPPTGASFASAMLALRSQDVAVGRPDEIFVAVIAGRRVFVVSAPVAQALVPVAACDAIWHAAERNAAAAFATASAPALRGADKLPDGDDLRERGAAAFRRCFAQNLKTTSAMTPLARQAQSLADRLPPHERRGSGNMD